MHRRWMVALAALLLPTGLTQTPASRQGLEQVRSILRWSAGLDGCGANAENLSATVDKAAAAGLGAIVGCSDQRLGPNLSEWEIAEVKEKLRAARVGIMAYALPAIPKGDAARRKLFAFARALDITTIVATARAADLEAIDKLVEEYGVNVALRGVAPQTVAVLLEKRGPRIGATVDVEDWRRRGLKMAEGVKAIGKRLMVVFPSLQSRSRRSRRWSRRPTGSRSNPSSGRCASPRSTRSRESRCRWLGITPSTHRGRRVSGGKAV